MKLLTENLYGSKFDKDVLNDLKKITEQIEEEKKNPECDREKLLQLRMQKLYRGMEMNNGYVNNYTNRGIPY